MLYFGSECDLQVHLNRSEDFFKPIPSCAESCLDSRVCVCVYVKCFTWSVCIPICVVGSPYTYVSQMTRIKMSGALQPKLRGLDHLQDFRLTVNDTLKNNVLDPLRDIIIQSNAITTTNWSLQLFSPRFLPNGVSDGVAWHSCILWWDKPFYCCFATSVCSYSVCDWNPNHGSRRGRRSRFLLRGLLLDSNGWQPKRCSIILCLCTNRS